MGGGEKRVHITLENCERKQKLHGVDSGALESDLDLNLGCHLSVMLNQLLNCPGVSVSSSRNGIEYQFLKVVRIKS